MTHSRLRLLVLGGIAALALACSGGGDAPLSPNPGLSLTGGPADLSAVAVSATQIDLAWVDNATNENQYEVWRSTTGITGTYKATAWIGANRTSYSDNNLTAGKQYCYKVKATNTVGGGASPFAGPACATTPGGGATGSIKVTTLTTGSNLDPDGYAIGLDGGATQSIGVNATVTFSGLAAGDHSVQLTGVATGCSVGDQNPRTVSVTSGTTTSTTFDVTCGAAASGTIQVTTATTTSGILQDPDGYDVSVDGGAAQTLGVNASISFPDLAAGSHSVLLAGLAGNCTVNGSNPATVTVTSNATTPVSMALTCGSTLKQNQVLFLSTRGGSTTNIYLMNDDGSNLIRVTNNTFNDQDIAISPDGTTMVFSRIDQSAHFQLYRMRFDGSSATKISTNGGVSDTDPEWSPDGTRLVFESDESGSPEVWLMSPDGSGRVQLTNNGGENGDVDWSPDGSKIVFESHLNGKGDIYVINTDGTGLTNLTDTPASGEGDPNWSPDGTMITFGSDRTGTSQVFVMNADGSNVRRVTQTTATDAQPTWAPDNVQLAFASNLPGNYDVYKIGVNGSNRVRLTTHSAFDGYPEWTRPAPAPLLAARASFAVSRMVAAAAATPPQAPACVAQPGLPGCHRIPVIPDWRTLR